MRVLFILILVMSSSVFAHKDHSAPGAIPPAPHGGVIKEAIHKHRGSHHHDHVKASKKEVFIEGVYKEGNIELYPLELEPKEAKFFIPIKLDQISEVKIKTINPRDKSVLSDNYTLDNDKFLIKLENNKSRRIVVEYSGILNGARYATKVQVEIKN